MRSFTQNDIAQRLAEKQRWTVARYTIRTADRISDRITASLTVLRENHYALL